MGRVTKRIIATLLAISVLGLSVFGADLINLRIGTNSTSGSTRSSNVVGFDTSFLTKDNLKYLYRFSVTNLADDQDLADYFYSNRTSPKKFNYGTQEWHKAISDYMMDHMVTGAGDGYWLGDHDTVDYRGHIIHAIATGKDEDGNVNPYGQKLYAALERAVANSTSTYTKGTEETLYAFNSSTGLKHLVLSYETSRLFYDYVRYQYEHKNSSYSRDPYTYSMLKTLQQNVEDADVDDPIVMVIEVQAPVLGDGEHSVTSCDNETVYDPTYSYWATAADMVVRCGGSLEKLRDSSVTLTDPTLFTTDTSAYSKVVHNNFSATSRTDRFAARMTGSYVPVPDSSYDTTKTCKIYGNVWPNRWTELFYKNSYTEWGVRLRTKGFYLGHLLYDGKVNTDINVALKEKNQINYTDTVDSYTVATMFADYSGEANERDSHVYASIDRNIYPLASKSSSDALVGSGVDLTLYYPSKQDLISTVQDDLALGISEYIVNKGQTHERKYTVNELINKLYSFASYTSDYIVAGADSGANISLTAATSPNLTLYNSTAKGVHFPLLAQDVQRSGISYYDTPTQPATSVIGHLKYDQLKTSSGTPSDEIKVLQRFNSEVNTKFKSTPLKLAELLNYTEPLTTDQDLTLLSGAQLFKVRMKYAYHVDNYQHKIYLHNIQFDNPSYLTVPFFDSKNKIVDDNQIVVSYTPENPDGTLYNTRDEAERAVRTELNEVNSKYSSALAPLHGADPWVITSNYSTVGNTRLNIYSSRIESKSLAKAGGPSSSSTAALGGVTTIAQGDLGTLKPSEGYSGYKLFLTATQYHGDVRETTVGDQKYYVVDHPSINITEGFQGTTNGTGKLLTDYVARTRHQSIGDSSFCTTMRYNNIAYIEILDAQVEVLNSIDGFGVLNNLSLTDKKLDGEELQFTQLTSDKQLVLSKAMNAFTFKYYVAGYNTDNYAGTGKNKTSLNKDKPNGYYLTPDQGHQEIVGGDSRESNIDNSLLLNWDEGIHSRLKDANEIEIPDGYTSSNYLDERYTRENLRGMMYTTNLQRTGRLINSFLYPTKDSMATKTFADIDATADFSGMYMEAMKALVKDQCYVEEDSDDIHLYWDPTKFGGTDYGTLPIASALFTSIYLYRQCNYIYVMDDSLELKYDGNIFSICGAEPFDSSTINAIMDNSIATQLLLNKYYTTTAYHVLKEFTTGTSFKSNIWHSTEDNSNLNKISSGENFTRVASLKPASQGTSISWVTDVSYKCQQYIYWVRRMSGHKTRYCRYNNTTANKLDLMNDTIVRIGDGKDLHTYNSVRGYKALMSNPYIYDNTEFQSKQESIHMYGVPYIGYNAQNNSINSMPVLTSESKLFSMHGQYPYGALKESLQDNKMAEQQRELISRMLNASKLSFRVTSNPGLGINQTDPISSSELKEKYKTIENKGIYVDIDIPYESFNTDNFEYISPISNIVNIGGYDTALTAGTLNILRNNLNGTLNTGTVCATYKNILTDTRKYDFYIGVQDTAEKERLYTPKLLNLDKQLKHIDPNLSMLSSDSTVSSRDVGRTFMNTSLDSKTQSSIETANVTITENAEITASTPKLSKYIGLSDNEIETKIAEGVDVDKTYEIRDQRVATDLHTLDGSQYDEKLVSSSALGVGSHSEKSVTNVYNESVTTSLKTMKTASDNQALPGIDYVKTPNTSGTYTVSENGELRYVTQSGIGVAFAASKGEEYYYNQYGIQRKRDLKKELTMADIARSTGNYITSYENAAIAEGSGSISLTPLGKDTDGIHIKLGDIYDTKNNLPRLTELTAAKYVSIVPNFKFIDQEYNSNTIAYHGVQLDKEQQYQSFSFHLNNDGFAWKPETKDFTVLAADDSNRVIATVNNQNNFLWKDLQSVSIKHILNVKFMEHTYSTKSSDSNFYQKKYSEFIPNFSANSSEVKGGLYYPYPQIAYDHGTLGQLADGSQFYYQKDMQQYDKLVGKEITQIPALKPDEYNLYRLEFKYNGKTVSCYIEQGLLVTSMTHTTYTNKLLEAYNNFTDGIVLDSLVEGRHFNQTPLNYLYDTDVKSDGTAFRRAVVFGDLPVPYITGTEYDNDVQNVEYDDEEGDPKEEKEYFSTNKTSGIPLRAGDFFQITFSIEDYLLSEHGAEPIKFSFLEDTDDGYVIDNTKDWANRKNLDKTNATIEIVYDSTANKSASLLERTTVFRMLRNANIQPSIRIPNSAKVVMLDNTVVFRTFDTTILSEGTNHNVAEMSDIIDPILSSPSTYGDSSRATSAYNAYANGRMVASDFATIGASTPYTIYNECIADVFILNSAEVNTGSYARMMLSPYGKIQKAVFDPTMKHLVNTQDALVGTKTVHGAIIHSRRDSLWTSPNARFNTLATNPAGNTYRYGDDKYHTEYLLRNARMTKLIRVKTLNNRSVVYNGIAVNMNDAYIFKVNGEVYVSPTKEDLTKNITLTSSGTQLVAKQPDVVWLYYDSATAPATAMKSTDYISKTTITDHHYLDFKNNGKYFYCFEIGKTGENDVYDDTYDIDITNYNATLAQFYNTPLLSSTTTSNYIPLEEKQVLQREGDAHMFTLDDEFTVKVDFKSLSNIKNLKWTYLKFPFPVYIREGLPDESIEASDAKLVRIPENTPIPLGQYFVKGVAKDSTVYKPDGGTLDLGTLSLDGMTCNTLADTGSTETTTRVDTIYYNTDETCHFVPYQYKDGVDKFEFTYHFWVPLGAGEWCNAQYELHAVPYNCHSIAVPTFGTKVSYIANSHVRNTLGYKNSIDVVGRIGVFTLNDLADFRWSDTLKKEDPSGEWYAYGLVHKTTTDPKMIVTEPYDIRGTMFETSEDYKIQNPTDGKSLDTYGTQTHRDQSSGVTYYKTPMQTSYNIHPGLKRSFPLNGYSQFYSIETTGLYYGQSQQPVDIVDNMKTGVNSVNSNNEFGQEKVQVIPVYYDIAIDDRGRYRIYPLDVYQRSRNGSYTLINRNLYYDKKYGSKLAKVLKLIDSNSYYLYETNNTSNITFDQTYNADNLSKYISDNLKRKNIMTREAFITKRVTTYMNNFLNMVAIQLKLIVGKNNQTENTSVRTTPLPGTDLASLVAGSARLYQIMSIVDNFGSVRGSTSNLLGERYIQGTAQASFLRERAHTYIGGPTIALGNDEMEDVFENEENIDVQTQMNAQKYYFTQQVPSDVKYVYSDYVYKVGDKAEDIFLPNEETLTYKDSSGAEQKVNIKHYILTRFNIIANGSVWSLRYNVPNKGSDTVYILDRAKTDAEKSTTGFDEANKLPTYVDIDEPSNYFNNGSIRFFSGDKERASLYDPPASGFGSIPSSSSEESDVATNLYKDPSGATIARDDISTTDKPSTTETAEEKTDPSAHTNTTRDYQGKTSDNSNSSDPSEYGKNDPSSTGGSVIDPSSTGTGDPSNGVAKDPSTIDPGKKDPPTTDGLLSQDPPGAPTLPNNSNLDDLSSMGTH